ncbi:hypothetical protein ASPWEDRAFT_118288 [Aspergillus wentii DTO 134E9]|uniref:Bis(5'-adenosyl)-triphosphatase n=1 Tax=Aspergillus wentii DTO 134E9 TaxID=1073089 RepID=A0A1L9RBK0_ASPWE|nr:uncharacterized protein ASPWEDRAFT_118288 [Aspergillus wentii DTO 134E9]OJJ32302.1 hypothetical protein ASPWEDRAFT_118288 [Aspergillus wentii DTO 134E9]
MSLALKGVPIHFGPFLVTSQVFHLTPLTFALVNLKPILPGHVLVSPRRRVPRVSELTAAETSDLFLTVRRVGRMVERVYGASSLNIAVQDGVDAGQSVAHVHTHIIPRKKADLDYRGGTDAVYEMLDGEEGDLGKFHESHCADLAEERPEQNGDGRRTRFPAVDNEERKPRSLEEMEAEAEMLAKEMEKEPLD